jgi:hypothetical protein
MKKLLVGLLISLSLFANADIVRYVSKDGIKLDIIDLPEHAFVKNQKFDYRFPSKRGNESTVGVVTIISANEGVSNGVIDGELVLMLNDSPFKSAYKARFDETGSLIKFRLEYRGAIITFSRHSKLASVIARRSNEDHSREY